MPKHHFEIEQIDVLNDERVTQRRHVDNGTFAQAYAKARELGARFGGADLGHYAIKVTCYLQAKDFKTARRGRAGR